MSLKLYFYIDEEGVNSLYNQIAKNVTNKKITKIKSDKDNTNLQLDIGLKNIFNSEIQQAYEYRDTFSIETQIEITIEEKINRLLEVNEIKKTYGLRVGEVIELFGDTDDFICCKGIFNLVGLYNYKGDGKFEIINPPKSIIVSQTNFYLFFQYGATEHNKQFVEKVDKFSRDSNYRLWEYYLDYNSPYGVEMFLEGINMRRKVLSLNGQIEFGKSFKLHILGKLEFCGENFYKLNPIAIWQ